MSSLLEPDSSFTQSTTAESTTSTLSHDKRKWWSPVWQYCRRPMLNEDQTHLYCTHCLSNPTHEDYKEGPFHGNHAENMKKHLKRHHGITIEKALSKNQIEVNHQLRQLYCQAEATSGADELDSEILRAQLNKTVITEALISMIVVRNLSFCLVEWPEFHTLCQALNQECEGIITTTHSQVHTHVSKAWNNYKDIVRRELQAALS
jgi:hypothetical protein